MAKSMGLTSELASKGTKASQYVQNVAMDTPGQRQAALVGLAEKT